MALRTVVVAKASRASPERIAGALLNEQTTHERRENRPQNETDDTEPLT
jgi:hypothetical protein